MCFTDEGDFWRRHTLAQSIVSCEEINSEAGSRQQSENLTFVNTGNLLCHQSIFKSNLSVYICVYLNKPPHN